MKKIIAVLLSGVMLASLVLCSCTITKSSEAENSRETGGKEKAETQVEATGTKADKGPAKLDEENIKKVYEYFLSIDPECEEGVILFLDGIRGNGYVHVDDKLIFLSYSSNDYDSFGINVMRDTGEVYFSIDMSYDDTGYSTNVDFPLGGFEEFFDKASTDPASVDPYNTSALGPHGEDIKKDLPIIFSRMIAFSDVAFSELGLGFKDLGIDFGDKYRAVDPKQTTSKEVEITNEHNFVNGFCVDCGLSWGEYFYDVVGKLMHVDLGNGQHYTRGQYSSTMLTPGDKVSCAADKPHFGSINYESRVYDKDKGTSKDEFCYIDYSFDDSELRTQLYYSISQRLLSDNAASYDYTLTVRAKPGEYNKIFKSKDALKKYVDVSLSIRGSDINDYIENAWEKMKEDEIKKKFDSDGLTYYTKDEIIDMFWDHHINYFESMDNGMVWMKTSLADIGFNWKE